MTNYSDWWVSLDNEGVLTDTGRVWDEINEAVAKEMGLYYEPGLGNKINFNRARHVWGKDMDEQREIAKEFLRRSIEISHSPGLIESIQLFPHVKEVILELDGAGINMGIVTVSTVERAANPLRRNGLLGFIKNIISCHDMGLKDKPSIEGIRRFAESTGGGIASDKIIHIGDTAPDIRMAEDFGSFCIGCCYSGYNTADQLKAEDTKGTMIGIISSVADIRRIPSIVKTFIESRA